MIIHIDDMLEADSPNSEIIDPEVKEKKEKKKKKAKKDEGIGGNRTAQMMFRTTLRNFIDLTNIADNKANIMLSINAIIITITIPFMLDNRDLIVPTGILISTCVISIVFATTATRPIKMPGLPTRTGEGGQRSLFFFGNFYKMRFDDYKQQVTELVSDRESLEGAIISDLYYIGRTLGQKYTRIRLCYTIFMIGIVISVIALGITYALSSGTPAG
jgi:hypothetical protein